MTISAQNIFFTKMAMGILVILWGLVGAKTIDDKGNRLYIVNGTIVHEAFASGEEVIGKRKKNVQKTFIKCSGKEKYDVPEKENKKKIAYNSGLPAKKSSLIWNTKPSDSRFSLVSGRTSLSIPHTGKMIAVKTGGKTGKIFFSSDFNIPISPYKVFYLTLKISWFKFCRPPPLFVSLTGLG